MSRKVQSGQKMRCLYSFIMKTLNCTRRCLRYRIQTSMIMITLIIKIITITMMIILYLMRLISVNYKQCLPPSSCLHYVRITNFVQAVQIFNLLSNRRPCTKTLTLSLHRRTSFVVVLMRTRCVCEVWNKACISFYPTRPDIITLFSVCIYTLYQTWP